MVKHLGRLKIVTKYKEGACNYKYCTVHESEPGKVGRVLPGEKAFLLTRMGKIGTRTTIFYKTYHMKCFTEWAMWVFEQTPFERRGRKVMDLSPEDKQARGKLITTRARILRNLRTANAENIGRLIERIAEIDKQIIATGYPVLQFRGRRSKTKMTYDRFVQDVKNHYKHPLRVSKDMYTEAEKIGMLEQFRKDMEAWLDERNAETVARQGEDFEASQEDKEE
jgi:hypothetical protein